MESAVLKILNDVDLSIDIIYAVLLILCIS